MNDSVFFGTFDPLCVDAPETCNLCIAQPPVYEYESCMEGENGERTITKGFCCASCARAMLNNLEGREADEWAEEEAELESEHVDITDYQKRRLATFGGGKPK
ncbi:MAG TPA: hypothetical protein VMT53_01965 [Terriglobales bacterium]|nr:hypothetical protein [Terriglobales bacterium]